MRLSTVQAPLRHLPRLLLLILPFALIAVEVAFKPACRGLMDRDWRGAVLPAWMDSAVVTVPWSDLHRADGDFTGPGWEVIDRACAVPGLRLRLRILCGVRAPDFVKRLGGPGIPDPVHGIGTVAGGGIAIWNAWDGAGGTVPRFWTDAVLDRYEALMTAVAQRYEDAPNLCEVVDAACMTMYAEPFYRAQADGPSNQRLAAAGLTWELDRAAHERAMRIHERLFRRIRTALAINPWDVIAADGGRLADFRPTAAFVDWARSLMGPRLVLQNNGMGLDGGPVTGATRDTNHFNYLGEAPPSKGFQTRTLPRLGGNLTGLLTTIDSALGMGAGFIELPVGYASLDGSALATRVTLLEDHALPAPAPPILVTSPRSCTVAAGSTATLTAAATGTGLVWRWYRGPAGDTSMPIAGAVGGTCTTPPLTAPDTCWVRVMNEVGMVDSAAVGITVVTPPVIIRQPVSCAVAAGDSTVLSVEATGSGLNLQWFRGTQTGEGVPVPGATHAVFTTPPLDADAGWWVRVTNIAGRIDSAVVRVTVTSHPISDPVATAGADDDSDDGGPCGVGATVAVLAALLGLRLRYARI